MHAESEFYVARDVKNKQASASEAGPFIVKVSSYDEMDDTSRILRMTTSKMISCRVY
jgi:hypothetical protein